MRRKDYFSYLRPVSSPRGERFARGLGHFTQTQDKGMIKNLLFDMGGVVFRQDTEEAFRRFRQAGLTQVDDYLGAHGQKDFFLDIETGRISAETFCRRMAEVAGRDSISFEEAQNCWLGFFIDAPDERIDNLIALRSRYRVCLASNTNPFITQFVRSSRFTASGRPITVAFDRLFFSYEMREYKPSPAFFNYILRTEEMQPAETIFLDDSEANVRAAAALGLHTLRVRSNEDWMPALRQMLESL